MAQAVLWLEIKFGLDARVFGAYRSADILDRYLYILLVVNRFVGFIVILCLFLEEVGELSGAQGAAAASSVSRRLLLQKPLLFMRLEVLLDIIRRQLGELLLSPVHLPVALG